MEQNKGGRRGRTERRRVGDGSSYTGTYSKLAEKIVQLASAETVKRADGDGVPSRLRESGDISRSATGFRNC